jgi:hypothetical protein
MPILGGALALFGDAVLALHFREAGLLALAVVCVRAVAGVGGASGGFLLLRHRRMLSRLPLFGLLAFAPLRGELLLPAGILLARPLLRLLPLPVGALLLLRACAGLLFALAFLRLQPRLLLCACLVVLRPSPLLFRALLLHPRAIVVLLALLFLHALLRLVPLRVDALRIRTVRRRARRLLRGRVRRVLVLTLVVARVLVLLLRGCVARDGRAGDADRQCQPDDAGQGVHAHGLHVRPPGRDCDRLRAVGVEGA